MSAPTFTADELREQAQGNATAILLATLAYLKRNGGSIADWTRFAGTLLAPGWRNAASFDALQLGRAWALNFASTGGIPESLKGDARRAELIVRNWPAEDDLRDAGLTREDVDPFLSITVILTQSVGATCAWSRVGERVTFIITR